MVERYNAAPRVIQNTQDLQPAEEESASHYNKDFVRRFETLQTFDDASEFMVEWLKGVGHNPTDFTNDLQEVLDRGCFARTKLLQNPEATLPACIYAHYLEDTENDYIIAFALRLLEAFSMNEQVPQIVCRIIINTLFLKFKEQELTLTDKHRDLAQSMLPNIRVDILFDYVQKLGLSSRINNDFYKELAKQHVENEKYHEAGLIIHKFKFRDGFDIISLLDKLVALGRLSVARQICEMDLKYTEHLVRALALTDNCKDAMQIVREYKMDLNNFPELKDRQQKQGVRYILSKFLYKRPTSEDYLSLDRIEDLFSGYKHMLQYLVEDLVNKEKLNQAKGVCERNNLIDHIKEETRQKLLPIVYDKKLDPEPYDMFAPLTEMPICHALPSHVKYEFISSVDQLNELDELLQEPYIGVDSEWRPTLSKFQKTAPSILQFNF